jgi:Putative adhesin
MTSWEFPGSDPIDIFINIAAGSVAVSAEATEATTVNLEPGKPGRRDNQLISDIEVTFEQGRLEIGHRKTGFLRNYSGVEVTVKAPAGSRCTVRAASAEVACVGDLAELHAKTASGDITAASVSGPLEVTTASGDVWLENAAAGARVKTASGDIRLGSAGGEVWADTASGDVRVGAATTSVRAHTASGTVRIGSMAAGTADVKTVSGNATVGIPAGIDVYLDLSSLTGKIKSQIDETQDGGDVGLTVTCRTVSGDIRIARADAGITG